jgi:tetratricopeptide (TPR) repeat protein
MMRALALLITLVAPFLIAACASNSPASGSNDSKNTTISASTAQAERMSARAAASYRAGDLGAAQAGYEGAALIYESLALAHPQAMASLSAARVMAESATNAPGTAAALSLVQKVLADGADLSPDTRITAHGRAAALHLQLALQQPSEAATQLATASAQLQAAQVACNNACSQAGALLVLRARLELAQGNGAASVVTSAQALGIATDSAGRANALRARAQANAQLGAHSQVIADAQEALALDRAAGLAGRVQLDLQLLAAAHQALGQTEQAQRYAQLAARSGQAQQRIERGLP